MEAALQGPSDRTVLGSSVLTIGRASDNKLVLNDPKASGHHAEVFQSGQGYSIKDLGSTNGTFVNDQRIERNIPRQLNAGDRVRIGDTTFTYEITGPTETLASDSGSEFAPTVMASPAEQHTAYGMGAEQQYAAPPQQPPYSPVPPPPQYVSSPQQPSYTPPAPAYQPYAQAAQQPAQQPYMPPPANIAPGYAPPGPPQHYPQQAYVPPAYTPPPAQKKPGNMMRIVLIAAAIVIVLGGGGLAAYLLTRPQPVITVTSSYNIGQTPAGSTSTVLHISGQHFTANSTISFLLDNQPAPGTPAAASDANGNVKADLTITGNWPLGSHTLTAKDGANYVTKTGVIVDIVPQGQAGTPGPNGAPTDSATFTINANLQTQDAVTGQSAGNFTQVLKVSHGTVCQSVDNGQPQPLTGNSGNGITYHETVTWTCSGTYKAGKVSYTETATSDKIDFSNGVSCIAQVPYVALHMDGTFSSSNTISGTLTEDPITANCTQGLGLQHTDPRKGTWNGQAS